MSRRARRQRKTAKRGGGIWLKLTALGLALAGLVMVGGYVWVRQWLHGEDFRKLLSAEAGEALGAETEFAPLRWDGTVMSTDSCVAVGDGVVRKVDARGLELQVGLGALRRGVVELRNARLTRIGVTLDLRESARPEPRPREEKPVGPREPAWYQRFLPQEVHLTELDVGESALRLLLESGEADFSGTRWAVEAGRVPGSYEIEAVGGRADLPWEFVPPLALRGARLRYQDLAVFLTAARFSLFERGELHLTGETSLKGGNYAFDAALSDVRAGELLEEDWKQRLEGVLESDFDVVDRGDGVVVSGELRLMDGSLTGLPVLDSLGAYGGDPRFRRLVLSEARTDFRWENGGLMVSDFVLASDGLLRIEGMLRIDAEDRLDGRFRIGLVPGTLSRIPGAETRVFLPGERGLLWAPVRVGGTVDDPQEDLTERLIEAAGLRMFELLPESGEWVMKYSGRVLEGDLKGAIKDGEDVVRQGRDLLKRGKGLLEGEGDISSEADEVIRQTEDVVRGVEGLLDSLRGKKRRTEPVVPAGPEQDEP